MIKTISLTALVGTFIFLFLLNPNRAEAQGDLPTLDAVIIATSQSHTEDPDPTTDPDALPPLAIGEIVTFEVTISLPNGTFPALMLEDKLDRGLAFVAVESVKASNGLQTNVQGGFAHMAQNATISNLGEEKDDQGRRLRINLGDLSSDGTNSIRLVYGAVAINSDSNHNGDGSRLGNNAHLMVDGALIDTATAQAYIVEPFLDFNLTADPPFGDPGDTIHFTLKVTHRNHAHSASNADALNPQVTITLPEDLTYVPDSLRWSEIDRKPARVNDSNAPMLRVVWSDIGTRRTSSIEFSATIRSDLTAGLPVRIPLRATWTSLPGTTENPLSPYNGLSVERTGNSSDIGGAVNNYRVRSTTFVATPFEPAIKTIVATSSEQTGSLESGLESVTIGEIIRYRLAMRLDEGEYDDLRIIEKLPAGLAYINDNTATIAFVANEHGIKSSVIAGDGLAIRGNDNLATPTFILPTAAVVELAGDPTISIQLGNVKNSDSDGDAEYIIVEFNALVLNQAANGAGKELVNNFNLTDDSVNSSLLVSSNDLAVRIVEPTLTISNVLTVLPEKIGDPVQYQVTVRADENSDTSTAYDVVITDAIDANLLLQEVRIDPASTANGTIEKDGKVVTVNIGQMGPGEELIIALDAIVSDAIIDDISVQNRATLQYATLPTDGGTPNPTGSIPANGSRRSSTKSADAASFFIEAPKGDSQIALTNRAALLTDADSDGQASAGDRVRYTLEIENNSAFAGQNLTLLDHLPATVALVPNSIQSTGGQIVTDTLLVGPLTAEVIDTSRTVAVEFRSLPPQQAVTITFDVIIDPMLDANVVEIAHQAIVFGENIIVTISDDPETLARDDATTLLLVKTPRLSATKSLHLVEDGNGDGLPSSGDVVEHRIIIVNEGTGDAPGVIVDDLIDPNIHVLDETIHVSQGETKLSHVKGNDALHVDIGTVAPDEYVTITFQSRVNSSLLETVKQISGQAIISSKLQPPLLTDDPSTPIPEDATNLSLFAAPTLQAGMIGLLVADRDQNGFPSLGDVIAYQVKIANSGKDPASGVTFTDTLPPFATILSGTVQTSNGVSLQLSNITAAAQQISLEEDAPNALRVDLGELRGGSSTIISFLTEISADAPADLTILQNQGSVQSNELPDLLTDSPVINGHVDPTTIILGERPHLVLTLRDLLLHDGDGNRTFSYGDRLVYLFNVINIGNAPANDLILEDQPGAGTLLTVGSVQSDRGVVVTGNIAESQEVIIGIAALPAGNKSVAAYQVLLAADAQVDLIENQATVTYSDPNLRTQDSLDSDDPDTSSVADPTTTLVFIEPTAIGGNAEEPEELRHIYLPITQR